MAKFNSRGARLTALALATGTLVVAATGTAGANPVAVPAVFGGTAEGTAIHLEINLPSPIPANVPVIGGLTQLTQDISLTQGETGKQPTKVTSVANAVLGNGNVVGLDTLLGRKVKASLDGQSSANDAILAQDVNGLIKVGAGQIASSVAPDSATSGLTSASSSSLLDLHVGLSGLNLPMKSELTNVLGSLNSSVQDGQNTLSQSLDSAISALNDAADGAAAPVAAEAQVVKDKLMDLVTQLRTTLGSISADTSLVDLSLLKSTSDITRSGAMVTAKATSLVGGLNILGGLVTVDTVKTESVSSANGVKGAAAADTRTTIAHVKVANQLELSLTKDGLSGTLLGQDLPAAAQDAVKTVIATINGVLATAGVQIIQGEKKSEVDPAGQFASSSSDGVAIAVNPLHAAKPLVLVQLVPAGTAVNAAQGKNVKTPNTPQIKNPETDKTMPRTGAELPLFALLGTGLTGAALVARRRRTVEA